MIAATRLQQLTAYLTNGGLFNPEMMEHDKVRDMLMELRKDVAEIEEIREYLWPNQTGLPNKHRNALVAIKARERLAFARVDKLETLVRRLARLVQAVENGEQPDVENLNWYDAANMILSDCPDELIPS